jgi:hypothetical protein
MHSWQIGVAIACVAIIIEIILNWKWNAPYFRTGIPIFLRRIEKRGGIAGIDLEALEQSTKTAAGAPFAFRRLGPDLIAFRERAFGGYIPMMRGAIRSNAEESSIAVAGLLHWSVIIVAIVLAVFLRRGVLDVAPYFLGLLAVLYFIQAVRFNRVATKLRGPAHAEEKVAGA